MSRASNSTQPWAREHGRRPVWYCSRPAWWLETAQDARAIGHAQPLWCEYGTSATTKWPLMYRRDLHGDAFHFAAFLNTSVESVNKSQ